MEHVWAPGGPGSWAGDDVASVAGVLSGRRVLVLAGAGCSTESGIPDYRSPAAQARPRTPMTFERFMHSAPGRVRYWARSSLGWPRMRHATPNAAHVALAQLELAGAVEGVISQNVDGLHHAAGSRQVLELHGALRRVRCMACPAMEDRQALQARLLALNPGWLDQMAQLAPDGDADVEDAALAGFVVPSCLACGGLLKPDVVFFGENVPKDVVARAWGMLDAAEVLLVVGSSLTVFSGFRFVRHAAEQRKPVAIINMGPTRGDALATLKLEARLGDFLPLLAERLGASGLPGS